MGVLKHPQTQDYLRDFKLSLSGLDSKLLEPRERHFIDFHCFCFPLLKVAPEYLEAELIFHTKLRNSLILGMTTQKLSTQMAPNSQKKLAIPSDVFLQISLPQRKDYWEEFPRAVQNLFHFENISPASGV